MRPERKVRNQHGGRAKRGIVKLNIGAAWLRVDHHKSRKLFQSDIDDLHQRFGFHAISVLSGIEPVQIDYPIIAYPSKVSSFNFDTDPTVEGVLTGIKGQYLIFDTGVINMRRFSGYNIEFFA